MNEILFCCFAMFSFLPDGLYFIPILPPCMIFQVLELWGEGDTPEKAAEAVKKFPEEIKRPFFAEDVTWSVTV